MRQKVRSIIGHSGIPTPFYKRLIDLYFVYYSITRKFFQTAKDKQYKYKLDKQEALLPENLIVGHPQHFVPQDKLARFAALPKNRLSL